MLVVDAVLGWVLSPILYAVHKARRHEAYLGGCRTCRWRWIRG